MDSSMLKLQQEKFPLHSEAIFTDFRIFVSEVMRMSKKRTGLRLTELGEGLIRKILTDYDGTVIIDETVLPHEELIRFMDRKTKDYYKKLKALEAHPLFKESLDVSEADLLNLSDKAFAMTYELCTDFPEAYFFTRIALEDTLVIPDDGSASFLLNIGMRILNIMKTPYLTQVRMRNIMEVCFGTTDSFTQRERFEKICKVYPTLNEHAFTVRWTPDGDGWAHEYEVRSLLELYVFYLMAALRSDKRITRCQHCWRYFVPKTKKKTDYCDRVWKDGRTCKELGPNLKRKDGPAEDKYLLVYKKLRARFYERDYREYANERERKATSYEHYEDWMEDVAEARAAYLSGEIDGEELLRRINPDGEPLELTEFTEPEPLPLSSSWRELIEGNMSFDPNKHFETMQFLDLGAADPKWRTISASEQSRDSRRGELSLLEKYRKKK